MTRRRTLPLADRLRVRTPCDVGWHAMEPTDEGRHCARCELTVHDVAKLTRAEVETLLEARLRGERVCLHLQLRPSDGAVLVADGWVERAHAPRPRAYPSRVVAAAVATATAMTACSSAAPPPEAPHTVIAIGTASTPATPLETLPPSAPPPPPRPPEPAPIETTPSTPSRPTPSLPTPPAPPTSPSARATAPAHAKPAPAKHTTPANKPPQPLIMVDGDAW